MDQLIRVRVKKLVPGAVLPTRATPGSAGFDICAHAPDSKGYVLEPGERVPILTGLAFEIPIGHEMQVRPRSGLAIRKGLMIVNSPGTIDSDYRGELIVLVLNAGKETVEIKDGERVAQVVVMPVPPIEFVEVNELAKTERGAGGFGSTKTAQIAAPSPSRSYVDLYASRNQCDGCLAGRPVDKNGHHRMGDGEYPDLMSCQRSRYEKEPGA